MNDDKKVDNVHIPKWARGFNVEFYNDEHCMAHDDRRGYLPTEERKIRSAVLNRAIKDLAMIGTRDQADAIDWILGDTESSPGFKFDDICTALNINEKAAREKLISRFNINV